jgi:putative transposase
MKEKIFSEAKIIELLKAGEAGLSVSELSRKYSVGESTYYKWKAKYGGMSSADLKRLKAKEHRRLKQMYATLSMDHELLREVLEKKLGVDLSEEI